MAVRAIVSVFSVFVVLVFVLGCLGGDAPPPRPLSGELSDGECLVQLDVVARGISVSVRNFKSYSSRWDGGDLSDAEYRRALERFDRGFDEIDAYLAGNENVTRCPGDFEGVRGELRGASRSYGQAVADVLAYLDSGADRDSRTPAHLEDALDALDAGDGHFQRALAELQRREKALSSSES